MDKDKLYLIGNAHIDPVWLWNWQEGFHEVLSTFYSALNRMDEFDDFIFTSSSAAFFAWVEQVNPAMFEKIQQRVREGRLEICGGWWVEPDCNIPAGESFARHSLYSQRYFMEKFGKKAVVGYNVDSFGHNANLPQIYRKSGIRYYVFMRPEPKEKDLPGHLFYWKSRDGSELLTFRIIKSYNWSGKDIENNLRTSPSDFNGPFHDLMFFYGVGNHGGGPTIENLKRLHDLQKDPELPELIFSTTESFFKAVEKQNLPLKTVRDDLQHHSSGCYSVNSSLKRLNRQTEHALMAAEKFCAAAHYWVDQAYPLNFEHAWKKVLFNQFHDILAGTSLPSAYRDVEMQMHEAGSIAAENQNLALQALAWQINIPLEENAQPIVVFNPHSWRACLEAQLELGGPATPDGYLLDETGQQVTHQLVQSETACLGRFRLAFLADLPPIGYRVYRWIKGTPPRAETTSSIRVSGTEIENDRFLLKLDPSSGLIQSLTDKRIQKNIFAAPAADPVVIDDNSDTWSHNVLKFDQVAGHFSLRKMALLASGPVKAVLRAEYTYQNSTLFQDFILYAGIDRVDVHVTVDWHERHQMLKIRFPMNLSQTTAVNEIPYSFIERKANGDEEPCQNWIDITGKLPGSDQVYGVSILNNAKYSCDILGNNAGLTVLRSPIYAHHTPYQPDTNTRYRYVDQGEQEFTYCLFSHLGPLADSETVRQAWQLNQPAVCQVATFHPGKLAQSGSFIDVNAQNVVVSVLKKAEDGDHLIVRAYETAGRATIAEIGLPVLDRRFTASFKPTEIKTYLIPLDDAQDIVEVNLLEEIVNDA